MVVMEMGMKASMRGQIEIRRVRRDKFREEASSMGPFFSCLAFFFLCVLKQREGEKNRDDNENLGRVEDKLEWGQMKTERERQTKEEKLR